MFDHIKKAIDNKAKIEVLFVAFASYHIEFNWNGIDYDICKEPIELGITVCGQKGYIVFKTDLKIDQEDLMESIIIMTEKVIKQLLSNRKDKVPFHTGLNEFGEQKGVLMKSKPYDKYLY